VVGEFVVQIDGVPEFGVGVVVSGQPRMSKSEIAVGDSLCRPVVQAFGGVEAGLLGRDQVVPMSLPVEEDDQSPGELPGVGVEPAVGGQADRGNQCGVFGGEPCCRLDLVGESLRCGCGVPVRDRAVLSDAEGPSSTRSGEPEACHGVEATSLGTGIEASGWSGNSSGALVFMNQAAEHVDSLHRRHAGVRPDQRQPGSRVWRVQVQAAVRPCRVVMPQVFGQHPMQLALAPDWRWLQISVQPRHSARTVHTQRSA
jgi:hypothetical protein